jgi:hypothetical protein
MFLINKIKEKQSSSNIYIPFLIFFIGCLLILTMFNFIDYGIIGILIPVAFYFYKESKFKFLYVFVLLILLSLTAVLDFGNLTIENFVQFFSILSIPLLMLYNNQKGKLNLKFLFYIFYPLHLAFLYFITLI